MEAVIIVPVMMLILVVVVQMALWAHAAQVARLAASEGDRVAQSAGAGAAVGVNRARAVLTAPGSDVESANAVALLLPDDQISVTVTGRALSLLPGISLPVSATQIGPVQEFRASE
ncbi:MAG TPA: TadE/TadG family type IV pilus assembly protein [Acidimicrobiales bacterium]|nr:TadE/TadG family type IV pilus assembly protein [Acidimicrobiales bacterium]